VPPIINHDSHRLYQSDYYRIDRDIWYLVKAVSENGRISVFILEENRWVLVADYSIENDISGYVGMNSYHNSLGVWDDFVVYDSLSENTITSNDNLTAIYYYEDKEGYELSNVRIRWYNHGIVREDLTQITLNPKKDLSNVNNTLFSEHISIGDLWHAEIILCNTKGLCSTEKTSPVRVIYVDNGKGGVKPIENNILIRKVWSGLTDFFYPFLTIFSIEKEIVIIPVFLLLFFIIEFMFREAIINFKKKLQNAK
jgi:hypothetical protein